MLDAPHLVAHLAQRCRQLVMTLETHRSGRSWIAHCRWFMQLPQVFVEQRRVFVCCWGAAPQPFRRILPVNEAGALRSLRPRPIVLRATFVARDAAATPPRPAAPASAATCNRRPLVEQWTDGLGIGLRMGCSSIMNPLYVVSAASRIPPQTPHIRSDLSIFGVALSCCLGH